MPVILVDWDGFYASLMQFLKACDDNGTVGAPGAAQHRAVGCWWAVWAAGGGRWAAPFEGLHACLPALPVPLPI